MTSKTATIQCKPVTSFAGNNNVLAHYEQSCGYDQISHALSNIHGLYGCSCNLRDVISVYSLNLGKFRRAIIETKSHVFLRTEDRSKAQVISSNDDRLSLAVYVEHSPALEPRSDDFSVYRRS